jgi:signal transduction histidine kinase
MGDGWEIVMPFGVGVAGRIAERREAMIVQDLAAANAHEAFLRSGVKSLMGTPLLHNDELLGVIQVGTRESTQFEEGDLRLLEHAARRIAIAIDRARLFDAQREALVAAEAASRAKSAFLAVMSHELRTPLNAIAGFAQLLEEGAMGPLNAEQKQMLGRVTASAKHLSSIINDMLQYVEIERHPPQLVADGDSLDAILERIVQRARSASERAGVTIVRQAGGAGKVRVPAVPAEDILRRLLDNAIKFSPMGGSVTISDDIAGDNVRLTIADSGPGIPQDRREQVFAAFGRVDSSYTRAQDGAGMGLPLARARARQVGGDIVIDGEGPGARLVITLPRMG